MFLLNYFMFYEFDYTEFVTNEIWSFLLYLLFNYLISSQLIFSNFTNYFYLRYFKFLQLMKLLYFNYHRIFKLFIILVLIRKVILFYYFKNFNFY